MVVSATTIHSTDSDMETLKSLVAYTQSATTIKKLSSLFFDTNFRCFVKSQRQETSILLDNWQLWISTMMISVNGAWSLLTFSGIVLMKNARGLLGWSGCPSPLARASTVSCASVWNCDSFITHSRKVSTDSTWKFSNTHRWYRASICSVNFFRSFKYKDPFPSSADPLVSLKLITTMTKRSAKFSMSFVLSGQIGLLKSFPALQD